jgi:hypothetical protein
LLSRPLLLRPLPLSLLLLSPLLLSLLLLRPLLFSRRWSQWNQQRSSFRKQRRFRSSRLCSQMKRRSRRLS